jgi:hypothetical protein
MRSDRTVRRGQYRDRLTDAGLTWKGTNLSTLTPIPARLLTSKDIARWNKIEPNTAGKNNTSAGATHACAEASSDTLLHVAIC